jgi:hypothetical protein
MTQIFGPFSLSINGMQFYRLKANRKILEFSLGQFAQLRHLTYHIFQIYDYLQQVPMSVSWLTQGNSASHH